MSRSPIAALSVNRLIQSFTVCNILSSGYEKYFPVTLDPVCPCWIWLCLHFHHFYLRFLYFCNSFVYLVHCFEHWRICVWRHSGALCFAENELCIGFFSHLCYTGDEHTNAVSVANDLTTIHLTLCSCELYLSQVLRGMFWVMFLNKGWKQNRWLPISWSPW